MDVSLSGTIDDETYLKIFRRGFSPLSAPWIRLWMYCRQGQATRRKWFKAVNLNIYCFHTFKNILECYRGNASKSIDRCSTAMVSRDLTRLRISRAIMLCRKELAVNACVRTEIRFLCTYRLRHPNTSYIGLMRPIFVSTTKTNRWNN